MADKRPNILLITTDQQRFDTIRPWAPPFLRTPHINHLGHEGVTFSRAYAACPICVPSRVSIMTGKTPHAHRMTHNGESSRVIDPGASLPSLLGACGYQTAAIGKMHFGPQRARHGFGEMILPDDYYRELSRSGEMLQPMRHGLGQNELYPGMATVPEGLTLTSWIAEKSMEYILERRDPTTPFFLWVSFSKPHPPLDPPEPYYSMYRSADIPKTIRGDWDDDPSCPEEIKRARQTRSVDLLPPEIIREARAAYYGLITQIDYNLGRVFAALQDHDLMKDTLILFTSDHGEFLGDHLLAAKTLFHESAARLPFVLRLPQSWEKRPCGKRSSHLVTHADILPTLVRAAGGRCPPEVDGQDLLAVMAGEIAPRHYLEAVAGRYGPDTVAYLGITDGRWKYTWFPEGPAEQLFDLESDPLERKNLAGKEQYEERRRTLRSEIVTREKMRGGAFIVDGKLVRRPLKNDSVADRRSRSWPGFHTELYDEDVRH